MHNTDRIQQYMESGEFNPGELPQGEYPGEIPQEFQGGYQPEYQPEYTGEAAFSGELINPVTGEVNQEEELALAAELLSVSNEQELNQFLGGFGRKLFGAFKKLGSSGLGRLVTGALRTVAKTALPTLGGALGSLIPIPGVGTALGAAAANAAGDALGLEAAGLSSEDRAFEIARRVIRIGIESGRALDRLPESEFISQQELGGLISSIAGKVLPSIGSAVLNGLTGQASSGGQATGGLAGGLQFRTPGGYDLRLGGQAGGQVTGGTAVGLNAPAPNVPFQPSPPRQVLPYKPGSPPPMPWPPGPGPGPQPPHPSRHGRWIRRGRHIVVLNAYHSG